MSVIQTTVLRHLKLVDRRPLYYISRQIHLNKEEIESNIELPKKAKVVICGGGVQGAAVAYYLAKLGLGKETVLLEQGRLGSGSTWHSSGLVSTLRLTKTETKIAQESVQLYEELEKAGLKTGWRQCGSLSVARTKDRMVMFRRMKARADAWSIPCHIMSPAEAAKLCPIIETSDIVGAMWIPGDGVGDPHEICLSLTTAAKSEGVQVLEGCSIEKIVQNSGKVVAVDTNKGTLECSVFVNCGGLWARSIGKLSEPYVKVPLHPCEHYCLHTKPIAGLDPLTPVVKDEDGFFYLRENEGRLLAGGFELISKPAFEDGNIPANVSKETTTPPDWDHFHVLMEQMLHRVPMLGETFLERLCNGPEAFSPDSKWLLGEAPEIQNYFVAAGSNTMGLTAAGGLGYATAGLIAGKGSGMPADSYELELSRFLGLHNNRRFLRDRVKEVPGMYYRIPYQFQEYTTGRNLRMSPIYPRLRQAGAVFGQVMGYERPSWFEPPDENNSSSQDFVENEEDYGLRPYKIASTNTFGKPHWFDWVEQEYTACRETVGLSDYSSFTKMDLWSRGTEVVTSLQHLCSNDIDIPIGGIIHTGMHNENGGYENDISFARLAENHYMMIAPTIQQTRCKVWIQRHLPSDGSVAISDVTSMYTAICVMGPNAIPLLSELADTDLSPKVFPFFTFKELDVGLASGVRAMNLTHTGELGCVLYIPNEFALHVYSGLVDVGKRYGLRHAGYYAMRSLRIEKFYAFWGQDLDTSTTPVECGRSFRVKFDKKAEFIGKAALLRQQKSGLQRMYVQLLLQDHNLEVDEWPWGGEPILRNGKYVGATTTTGYGFTLRKQVCLGFVQNPDANGHPGLVTPEYVQSGEYEVDIAGVKFEAKVNLHSPVLPTKYHIPDQERHRYQATRGVLK